MCNELKCAIQSTVDLININITRDVQEECANRLYRVCTHSSNADDGEWWECFFCFVLQLIKLSPVDVMRLSVGAWWPEGRSSSSVSQFQHSCNSQISCLVMVWVGLFCFSPLFTSFLFFLSLSTISAVVDWKFPVTAWSLEWLGRDWVRNSKADCWCRTVGIEFFFLPQSTFPISWFPHRNEGVQHSSAIVRKSCPSGLSLIFCSLLVCGLHSRKESHWFPLVSPLRLNAF